ncbi:glucuronate isomerase [Devosia epidermidihirudinis]|uniref:Uronate isomerase n=1 Tax=Devosia epidermidihirudinis TaxID=1293439 RepID=A0A0F5Q5H2_9HYPH|nr:glucuronate isomerase [Devosia epidermidihirudinis]KKC35319.1 glucuronate isomerase [Devosia epidermidihirudinis]
MTQPAHLHPDRLLPAAEPARSIARELYPEVAELPLICPHGHTDPAWFANNERFASPTALFLTPDHYVLRMLRSRGLSYDDLGIPRKDGKPIADGRAAWRLFAANYHLFVGTPSKSWIDHSLHWAFGITDELSSDTADAIYDTIDTALATPDLLPRALLDRARVEVIATTEYALDPLTHHHKMEAEGLIGRVRTTYRPDDVTNPERAGFLDRLHQFGDLTGENITIWSGLINAHRNRREVFRRFGAVATDHGLPTALTADLAPLEKQALLERILTGQYDPEDADLFRAQMMTEMALLAVEDGMVMQLHAGARRNTDAHLLEERGPDLGGDVPSRVNYVDGLQPLLNRCGNEPNLRLIAFTLDESNYARELAPMAGFWPSLMIGPPWWFHDSPQGIRRYLDQVVESAGFYNLAGFNDDTRALLSIPARHDVWRREVCGFLAQWVAEHRLSKASARDIARHLSYQAAKDAYRIA